MVQFKAITSLFQQRNIYSVCRWSQRRHLKCLSNCQRCLSTTCTVQSRQGVVPAPANPRVLVTGAMGQLGLELSKILRLKFGQDNVVMTDVINAPKHVLQSGPFYFADVSDFKTLQDVIVTERVDWLIHLGAIVSAMGEQDVPLAIKVNIHGLHNVLELARIHRLRIFCPSTIGAFGPESQRNPTPDVTIQRPRTIYGISKVHAELLGEYYRHRFDVDFRSLRLPGIISDTTSRGGTTDYTVDIYEEALSSGVYKCYLRPNTLLPFMYIEDCLRGIVQMLEVPEEMLRLRTYNIAAMSFTPAELAAEIRKYVPNFEVTYEPDFRQKIADTWPETLDDSRARRDWGWKHRYNLSNLVRVMLELVGQRIGITPCLHQS